jgi:hypothetical protein
MKPHSGNAAARFSFEARRRHANEYIIYSFKFPPGACESLFTDERYRTIWINGAGEFLMRKEGG